MLELRSSEASQVPFRSITGRSLLRRLILEWIAHIWIKSKLNHRTPLIAVEWTFVLVLSLPVFGLTAWFMFRPAQQAGPKSWLPPPRRLQSPRLLRLSQRLASPKTDCPPKRLGS